MIHSESEILVGVSPILNLNLLLECQILLLECQNLILEIECQKSKLAKLNGKIYYLKFYHIECQLQPLHVIASTFKSTGC